MKKVGNIKLSFNTINRTFKEVITSKRFIPEEYQPEDTDTPYYEYYNRSVSYIKEWGSRLIHTVTRPYTANKFVVGLTATTQFGRFIMRIVFTKDRESLIVEYIKEHGEVTYKLTILNSIKQSPSSKILVSGIPSRDTSQVEFVNTIASELRQMCS